MGKFKAANFFNKVNKESSKCKFCQGIVKTSGNTTNLSLHLKRKHWSEKVIQEAFFESSKEDKKKPDVKDKNKGSLAKKFVVSNRGSGLNLGDRPTQQSNPGTSFTIEDSSENMVIATEVEIMSTEMVEQCVDDPAPLEELIPRTSENPRLVQPQISDIVRNIQSYSGGGSRETQLNEAILHMITRDLQPLSFVEDKGFLNLMKITAPLYSVPSRHKITTLLSRKYSEISLEMKMKLSEIEAIALTTDVWTDCNCQSYLGVTAHYLAESDNSFKCCTLSVKALTQSHTHEYLGQTLLNVCEDWNVPVKNVVAVIGDNAGNIVKSIEVYFGKGKQMGCFAHSLALVPTKAISLTDGLQGLITSVKSIVTFFHHSVKASDLLRKAQENEGTPHGKMLKLKQECPTRWNSTFSMIERFLKLSDIVNSILIKFPNAPPMLTARCMATLQEVLKLLKPLEQATDDISGDKYVTSSRIIPLIKMINLKTEAVNTVTDIGRKLKQKLALEMEKRFKHHEDIDVLAISTLIDPRFKRMHFKDPLAVSRTIQKVGKMMRNMPASKESSSSEEESLPKDLEEDLWSYHKIEAGRSSEAGDDNEGMPTELKQYLNQPVVSLKTDPLAHLETLSTAYPRIYKLARKYLFVPATSVPAERLFSKTGNILTTKRNRLLPEHLQEIVFLSSIDSGSKYDF